MKYGEKTQVINIKKADERILLDGALLAPYLLQKYLALLTPSELSLIQYEKAEVIYLGHNVIQDYCDLIGQDTERNSFHMLNGETVYN